MTARGLIGQSLILAIALLAKETECVASDSVPPCFAGWVRVPKEEALKFWRNNAWDSHEGVPRHTVSVENQKLVFSSSTTKAPIVLPFDGDMTIANPRFTKPTSAVHFGDNWLCSYDYGEFGYAVWVVSDRGAKTPVGNIEVPSAIKCGSTVVAVISNEDFLSNKLCVLEKANNEWTLHEVGILPGGYARLFPSDSEDEVMILTDQNVVRWNLKAGQTKQPAETLKLTDYSDFFPWMIGEAESVVALDGLFWFGCSGFICSIDPTVPGFRIRVFGPPQWKTWLQKEK